MGQYCLLTLSIIVALLVCCQLPFHLKKREPLWHIKNNLKGNSGNAICIGNYIVSSAIWNKFEPVGFRRVQFELFEITRVQIYSKLHEKIICFPINNIHEKIIATNKLFSVEKSEHFGRKTLSVFSMTCDGVSSMRILAKIFIEKHNKILNFFSLSHIKIIPL